MGLGTGPLPGPPNGGRSSRGGTLGHLAGTAPGARTATPLPQPFSGCVVPIENPRQPARPRLVFFFLFQRGLHPTPTPFPSSPASGLKPITLLCKQSEGRVWGRGRRGRARDGGAAGREARRLDWRAAASQVHLGLCRCERLWEADKWGEDEEVGTRTT